jgi:ABC-type nitrate/sulfonate/bicarbonate transport system substrate-binding protein
MLLRKAGVSKSDYKTTTLVGTPLRVACLEKGACDAVPVGQPDDMMLVQKGYRNLGNSLDVIPHLQFNVIAVRKSWAAEHRDAVMRYVRAFGAAYRYMNDPANKEDVLKLISETTEATADISRQIYAFYFEPYRSIMPMQAEIDMEGMKTVVALMHDVGELKGDLPDANRFVDLQYLQAAGLQ